MKIIYKQIAMAALWVGMGSLRAYALDAFAAMPRSASPIRAGCEPDYPPYCIVSAEGQADGFSVELLQAALQAMGLGAEFKTAPWTELKQDLADGRLQALPMVGRTPEREEIYDFTFPYLTMHGTIVVRQDNAAIRSPADLKGKQVAVLQGDNAEEFLRRGDLGAEIVPLPSFETALRELSGGKHDAVVIQKLLAFQLMRQTGLTNLVAVGPPLYPQHFCFAVREGDDTLLAALNEGLSIAMANGTFRTLYAKWFADLEATGRARSRIVVGGDHDYPPYEFLDANGQPAGFNVDLTRAIARHLGLAVDIRLGAWVEIRKGLAAEAIDAVQGMFYSAEREAAFDFSPPSTHVQHVIVVREGAPEPADLRALAGKSVLVMAGDIMEDLASAQCPDAQLVATPSQEEALRRLAAGEGDCALAAKVPARYWIQQNGWRNLKIVAPPILSAEYCYAVPSGRQELLAQFSEGLAALKASGEYRQIQAKWLSPYEAPGFSLRKLVQIVLLATLPLLVLLLAALLWSRTLQRRVAARTRDLRQANAFLDSIIENLPTMLFLKDAKALRFVRVNRAGEQLMGHPKSALVGKNDYDFFPKEQADFFTQKDREVLQGGHAVDIPEEPLQSATLGPRLLHTRKVPISNARGEPEYLLGISEDVTERKRAEKEREQLREKLIQLQKIESIGRLAGGVAHDFNNMLQAILGHVELALDQVPPGERLQRNLLEIRKAAERSADLTQQLLAFARKQTVSPKVLDLNETIENTLQILRRLIGESVALAWMPGRHLGPVKMDPAQIDQILTHLCLNARDAMPAGGKIAIETNCATFGDEIAARHPGRLPGEYVVLAVRDNGQGMDAETLGKIFEPFFTTKGLGQGTGLGLATVYGIVQQNQGFIEVQSEPGCGTVFRIYLPRQMDPAGQSV
ncbi:MAG: transporter substrate-binding domain-containing protein [Kiritimatiellia bacterium]